MIISVPNDNKGKKQYVRSKKVVFISECLLNQNIRAYGITNVNGEGPVTEILELLGKNGIGISVVSCPEISYEGLKRNACGRCNYENDAYRSICVKRAQEVIERYKLYLDDDYKVLGFICVNGSPSCGADFCFDQCGGESCKCFKPGVFIEELQKQLEKENLNLKFIGTRVIKIDEALNKIKEEISESW